MYVSLCLVCGKEEETLLSNCYANVMMQYCIMGAYSTASGAMQGINITPIAVCKILGEVFNNIGYIGDAQWAKSNTVSVLSSSLWAAHPKSNVRPGK